MDSLNILLEAVKSLNIETDADFTEPSFINFTHAQPWSYGKTLFNSILNVRFSREANLADFGPHKTCFVQMKLE